MTFKETRRLVGNVLCGFALLYFLSLAMDEGIPNFQNALSEVQANLKR